MQEASIDYTQYVDEEDIRRFLTFKMKIHPKKIRFHHLGDYLLFEILVTRHTLAIQQSSTFMVFLSRLKRMAPRRAQRMRDITAINKRWGSIDAMCILYAARRRHRLVCTGRPEAVQLIAEHYRPDVLSVTPWNPVILPICQGKEIITYAVTWKTVSHSCIL